MVNSKSQLKFRLRNAQAPAEQHQSKHPAINNEIRVTNIRVYRKKG